MASGATQPISVGKSARIFALSIAVCTILAVGFLAGSVSSSADPQGAGQVLWRLWRQPDSEAASVGKTLPKEQTARSDACEKLARIQGRSSECSFAFFSAHLLCRGHFPSAGSWAGDSWSPAGCTILDSSGASPVCPLQTLAVHLPAASKPAPRDVVIIGDSQGIRYTTALNRSLAAAGVTCAQVAHEAQTDFYGDVRRVETRRDCGGCGAFTMQCTGDVAGIAVDFQLTYLLMEFVLDQDLAEPTRIHWDAGSCNTSEAVPCRWAWTTQQFLFDAFFSRRARGYPAEIHVFQNIHDCARRNAADFRRDLRWLLNLIDTSAPSSSNVYLWEASAINPAKQPAEWARVTSNDCVRMMNTAVAEQVAPYVAASTVRQAQAAARRAAAAAAAASMATGAPGLTSAAQPLAAAGSSAQGSLRSPINSVSIDGRDSELDAAGPAWHGTYGLHEASLQRLDLNKDGVHFQDIWYDQVARLILAAYCPVAG